MSEIQTSPLKSGMSSYIRDSEMVNNQLSNIAAAMSRMRTADVAEMAVFVETAFAMLKRFGLYELNIAIPTCFATCKSSFIYSLLRRDVPSLRGKRARNLKQTFRCLCTNLVMRSLFKQSFVEMLRGFVYEVIYS
jgi:hypothetical protein